MASAIIDVRCWYCERHVALRRKKMPGLFTDDGRYVCKSCRPHEQARGEAKR